MAISIVFIVAFISLLLLPLTCLTIIFSLLYSSRQQHDEHHLHNFPTPAPLHQAGSISNLFLAHTLFSSNRTEPDQHLNLNLNKRMNKDVAPVKRYQPKAGDDEKQECGVCLSEIEQGEEVRELRCNHLFHKECLDSWISSGSATCPMCRGSVHVPFFEKKIDGHDDNSSTARRSTEVLFFEYCSFTRSSGPRRHQRDSWWIR